MTRTRVPLILLLGFFFGCTGAKYAQGVDYADNVNPLVGTDSERLLSNGNTYPAVALPWGMNFWTPQTGRMGDGWQYTYAAHKIIGFKQTHQPSPWIGDYGAFAILPETGRPRIGEEERASWYSHKRETARPYHYRAYLGDYDVWTEIAPTERCAQFRITYPASDSSSLLIDAFNKGSYIRILPGEKKIIGYCRNNQGGVPASFHNYFVIRYDVEITSAATWEGNKLFPDRLELKGDHVGALLQFKTRSGQTVHLQVASSFISPEQADINLAREVGSDSFEQTTSKAKTIWNEGLGRIIAEGGTEDQTVTFYTALYRTMLFPRKFFEYDREGRVMHYSPYNGQVLPGYLFTDNGFWDTFRAAFPLLTIMQTQLVGQIMEGLVNTYKESGWLPEWASPGHRDCMIGSNSASIVADAWLKGIRGYDIATLYDALLKNSDQEGPLHSVGRLGVKFYNELGYIPYDVGVNENAARTLEYSYDDFSIMKLAQSLSKPASEIKLFAGRARNYRNLFDASTGFMRGRNKDGSFQVPFRPDKWGDAFTEGCAWHYTWSVFHDPQGLIDLMGGRARFIDKLDAVFSAAPTFDYSYYGRQIHEITEMAIAGMGQYAHGNQPIQHGIYLYDWAGEPWKAQKHVRDVMDLLYTPDPDGLCGDEDNGQTSAWYVFSAMGFYPVCPTAGQYALGSPLFSRITLQLESGKKLVITANNNNRENVYISAAELNGSRFSRNYLLHDEIMNGGLLDFKMSPVPNMKRGIDPADAPYSLSRDGENR
ncbi:MAG: GH92 family glycosyl hydrolase [Ignavibacteriales bacterium]|nr:GH92 family glycosyl hydrolase [Ignavibacteriales bacterium]